jgi:hypothetical protein
MWVSVYILWTCSCEGCGEGRCAGVEVSLSSCAKGGRQPSTASQNGRTGAHPRDPE